MREILDFLLWDLYNTVRGVIAFYRLATLDEGDRLPFMSEGELRNLQSEFELEGKRQRKLRARPKISKGNVKMYLRRIPGRRGWLCPVYNDQGELVMRIYFDDGNVPDIEIKKQIAQIKSRYRPRRGGKPQYDEVERQILQGADPEEAIQELVTKDLDERMKKSKLEPNGEEKTAKRKIRAALRRRGLL